jgi:NAD(P)-dependent dehydrogenase (short-subunit alcohol dehydrogenase family)
MPSKLFDLSDRTCLVTGSARGLGNALAEGLPKPARRWGVPADLVGTAVYLASAASDYVNGQLLFVDRGADGRAVRSRPLTSIRL